jgi:hypothetical protein
VQNTSRRGYSKWKMLYAVLAHLLKLHVLVVQISYLLEYKMTALPFTVCSFQKNTYIEYV